MFVTVSFRALPATTWGQSLTLACTLPDQSLVYLENCSKLAASYGALCIGCEQLHWGAATTQQ